MGQSGLDLKARALPSLLLKKFLKVFEDNRHYEPAPPSNLGGRFGPFNLKIAQKYFIKSKKGLTVRDIATKGTIT